MANFDLHKFAVIHSNIFANSRSNKHISCLHFLLVRYNLKYGTCFFISRTHLHTIVHKTVNLKFPERIFCIIKEVNGPSILMHILENKKICFRK